MNMFPTITTSDKYGYQVSIQEWLKEQIETRTSIARLTQTSKALNVDVRKRIDLYTHRVLSSFTQNTVWTAQVWKLSYFR